MIDHTDENIQTTVVVLFPNKAQLYSRKSKKMLNPFVYDNWVYMTVNHSFNINYRRRHEIGQVKYPPAPTYVISCEVSPSLGV